MKPDVILTRASEPPAARIAFPFAGGIVGGSHISAIRLIQSLDRRAFEPVVLLNRDDDDVARLLRSEQVPFTLLSRSQVISPRTLVRDLFGARRTIRDAARLLRDRGIALVHTNDGAMHATWSLPARLAGTKLLWHHRGNPRARGLRYLAPWTADAVVSVSRYASPRPGRISAVGKNHVVHSPFETDIRVDRVEARSSLINELGVATGTAIIGYFGNLSARKRPLLFVDVIAEIIGRTARPVVGVMFGAEEDPGLEAATRSRIAERGLGNAVRLMGFRRPVEPLIAACDVLAVTAVEEPFGRTLIEAMLLGTPVVAARSGGNIEAIEHGRTGRLAEPDDAAAMAAEITALLDDPASADRLAEAARADAKHRFGVERHRRSIEAIYHQLLGTAGGA